MSRSGALILFFLLFVPLVAGCRSAKSGGSLPACEPPDLMEKLLTTAGEGKVRWERIEDPSRFRAIPPEEGGAFFPKKGDLYIENERIRLILQGPSRQISPAPYGGNLIDADIQREDGVWHDILGELTPFVGLSYTLDTGELEILREEKGVLVLRARGTTTLLDYINLSSAIQSLLGEGATPNLPWDFNKGIPLHISQYYLIRGNEPRIEIHTAVCNPTDEPQITTLGDLLDSGGLGAFFNREQIVEGLGGFGYTGDPTKDINPTSLFAFVGEDSGYGIIPHSPAWALVLSGVGVLHYGTQEGLPFILSALTGIDRSSPPDGYFLIPPHGSISYSRDFVVFQDFSTLMEAYYRHQGITPARVEGKALSGSSPIAGARIALVSPEGTLEGFAKTGTEGGFSLPVSPGTYTLYGDLVGWPEPPPQTITLQPGETVQTRITFEPPGYLSFQVRGRTELDPGSPVTDHLPAKITIECLGTCPRTEKRIFYDTLFDRFPRNVQVKAFVDHEGKVSIMAKRGWLRKDSLPLPPGEYRILISRGIEYSLFATTVTVTPGGTQWITAQIDRVVDTSGYISADLHVHAVNSPDSPLPLLDRVLTFMGEGVEILVSTDHDFITDYRPIIREIGAERYITSYPGDELTTFDLGHFNGYPLRPDPEALQNGAPDWAGGRGPNLTPEGIFRSLKERGLVTNPVVQVNHPRATLMGYFRAIRLDTDTLKTHANPETFRMDPSLLKQEPDDTGLFSDLFDAFEIYNNPSEIPELLNDFFAFLNIGLIKTGVAVSDTHHWYSAQAGVPRTFVYVGEGNDTPEKVDVEAFTRAIQKGLAIGTSGPFLRASLKDAQGKEYRYGELAPSPVELSIVVEMPDWMGVDTLEIFSNTPGTASRNGVSVKSWPTPKKRIRLAEGDFVRDGKRKRYSHREPLNDLLNDPGKDAWFVIIVRDDRDYGADYSIYPVGDQRPLAFTNALLADMDGNGKFDPPGASLAPGFQGSPEMKPSRREILLTEEELRDILREIHHHP
jgi:hypothetical protein